MLEFSHFDRRRYPTVSVREGYREWLPSYETTVEDEMDLVLLGSLESVPWTAVEHAADLGCGTGRTGAWLRARGVARLDGIDMTPEMLAIARTRGIYDHVVEADVAATGLEGGIYDLVTTCLVDDISGICGRSTVKRRGWSGRAASTYSLATTRTSS